MLEYKGRKDGQDKHSRVLLLIPALNMTPNEGYRKDLDKNFRSTMEANFYRYITWCHPDIRLCEYEPHLFTERDGMPKGINYLPDFRLTTHSGEQFYVEVCHIMDERHKRNCGAFRGLGYRLEIVDTKVYNEIKKRFAKKTRGWEW
jgi:hypothetical protein